MFIKGSTDDSGIHPGSWTSALRASKQTRYGEPGVRTVHSSAEECAWNLEPELKGELLDDSIGCWESSLVMGQRNSSGTLFFHLACLRTRNLVSWLLAWMKLILNRWVIVCEHRWRRNTECTGRAHTWKWAREEENDARGKGREKSEHSPGLCRKCPLLEISR